MRIRILSDLHNEFMEFNTVKQDCDIVVLAGDIGLGTKGIRWAKNTFSDIPVLYIAGNHEYYGRSITSLDKELLDFSKSNSNIFFLQNSTFIKDNVRFIGCTLWSDFQLFGPELTIACRDKSQSSINDFRKIKLTEDSDSAIVPIDFIDLHLSSLAFLEETLQDDFEGKNVVITHHAPSRDSLHVNYKYDHLSSAFASSLDWFIKEQQPDLWIHGHTHHNVDYKIGKTRIISNQRGYEGYELVEGFDKFCVVNIEDNK